MAETKGAATRRASSSTEINLSRSIVRSKNISYALVRAHRAWCQWQCGRLALCRKPVQRHLLHVLQRPVHFWEESVWWEGWLRGSLRWKELQREWMLEPQSQRVHAGLPGSSCGIQGKRAADDWKSRAGNTGLHRAQDWLSGQCLNFSSGATGCMILIRFWY